MESLAAELGIVGQVTFWGQQLDVAPFFSAADAFIMSSRSEGLPISLLQAFSMGLPAIVTDVGGMAEVVRLAQAGFTVSAADPAEMAAAILRWLQHAEREQFSANAESAFHAQFTCKRWSMAIWNFIGTRHGHGMQRRPELCFVIAAAMRASITTMSLPDGRYNRRVLAACREGGYTQVYTPVPRAEHEPLGFTVGRLNVHGDSTPEWNQNVLQPGSRALSGLERQYQIRAVTKTVVGDWLYEKLWALLNRKSRTAVTTGTTRNEDSAHDQYAAECTVQRQ